MRKQSTGERHGFHPLLLILFLAFFAAVGGGIFLSLRTPSVQQPRPTGCTLEAMLCSDGSAVGRTGPNCEFAACPPTATNTPPQPKPEPVFCTQDAQLCPDGSYVGRVGPNCAFAPCPPADTITPPRPCTLEAMLCSDGSAVGRTGPNCEFAPCPSVPAYRSCKSTEDTSCGSGYRCIQECGPPVAREDDPPPGWYCETEANANKPRMCPICLAAATNIATPAGEVNVQKLAVGMAVWSLDARGAKIASTIVRVAQTPAPQAHRVVHLVLSDGRDVRVSPNHPTITGLPVGQLRPGDAYDGARVVSADLEPYGGAATYDLLPDSATGAYWADGVLLGSTLSMPYISE